MAINLIKRIHIISITSFLLLFSNTALPDDNEKYVAATTIAMREFALHTQSICKLSTPSMAQEIDFSISQWLMTNDSYFQEATNTINQQSPDVVIELQQAIMDATAQNGIAGEDPNETRAFCLNFPTILMSPVMSPSNSKIMADKYMEEYDQLYK